jgi:L,D-peptidoglycan transpeptidase YkuD (ErfK/YbiS/YcfS/YnhG family)
MPIYERAIRAPAKGRKGPFGSRKRRRSGNPAAAAPRRVCRVLPRPGRPQRGMVVFGPLRLACALGRSGVTRLKREGDGATPVGRYPLERLIVRRDRLPGPASLVPARPMRRRDAWEEDPRSGRYNRLVHRHCAGAGDLLWRDDRLYDLVGVLDWNRSRRASHRGSAIFLHLCRPDMAPTAGCIALQPRDLKLLLARCGPRPVFAVAAGPRKVRRSG